ncbi:ClpP/crotonase [Diplocarpon rosae]|nr:ClpP/crotonase [Diplocarpon rosae]
MSTAVTLEYMGKIAIVTIDNQKKVNALTQEHGADVSSTGVSASPSRSADTNQHWLKNFVAYNLNITQAFYTHPEILVTALNGPAIGISAALIAFSDFIFCVPSAFLLTPFSSLGLVAEGGASRAFVQRLGISKANEALIMRNVLTQRIYCRLNLARTRNFVLYMMKIKALIRKLEIGAMDAQGVGEVFAGLERFQAGIPQKEFAKIASGVKRHKL